MNDDRNVYSLGIEYTGIDVFKFALSILVVLRHLIQRWCSPNSLAFIFITNGLSTAAVPYFFIATGFLFFVGDKNDIKHLKQQIFRLFELYFVWSVIYLPLRFLSGYKNGQLSKTYFLRLGQETIFSGTYYHLWYIPAAAVALIIVFFLKNMIGKRKTFILACALFVIGILDDSYAGMIDTSIFDTYNKICITTRNGVFFGTIFIVIGLFIATAFKWKISKEQGLITCGVLSIFLLIESVFNSMILGEHVNNMMLMAVPLATALFVASLDFHLDYDTKNLRKMSELIYFIHPAVMAVLGRITENWNSYLRVGTVTLISIAVSFCVVQAIDKWKVLKVLV